MESNIVLILISYFKIKIAILFGKTKKSQSGCWGVDREFLLSDDVCSQP